MSETTTIQLLERLCNAPGAPGFERPVRRIVADALDSCGELQSDGLGSLLCENVGAASAPRVMLDSHMDEVSFMVQSILPGGWIRIQALGGWWGHVLLGQRLVIHSSQGEVCGIVGARPPHFLSPAERDKVQAVDTMYLDIGASDENQVAASGVRVGDAVTPDSEFAPLSVAGRYRAKAFDNRVGVALMCRTMQTFRNTEHPNTLIGVGAVQEEVGCRGAISATRIANPDIAIVLECTPADDTPGFEASQAKLGHGPQLRLFDPTAIAHRGLADFVIATAAKHDLPLQLAVRRSGGTDAKSIHVSGHGIPSVVIGVPARYIHTHNSVLDEHDVDIAEQLLQHLVKALDASAVEEICRAD